MNGEASKSKSKKATAAKSGKQGKNQAVTQKVAAKKKSKEKKMSGGRRSGCCPCSGTFLVLALIFVTTAGYKAYPEKFLEAYEKLPPQVQDGLVQAREMVFHTVDIVSSKSTQIYGQGVGMVKEGYSMLPPAVTEYTDPAIEAVGQYSAVAATKVKEGYVKVADWIVEQEPVARVYYEQAMSTASVYGGFVFENGKTAFKQASQVVIEYYETVSPQAMFYFNEAKTLTVKYGKIAAGKAADLLLDAFDLAYDGYEAARPYVSKATNQVSEVFSPYIRPYVGPYWDIFYNTSVQQYNEVLTLTREWARQIDIGDVNLERLLFADEIKQEELQKAKEAAERIKAAVEAMNQKAAEAARQKAEEEAKEREQLEKQKAEEEARLKAEAEAKKKADEEAARKKAEEQAARKKAEEEAARKKAEEEAAKKKAEEEAAKKKAEEEAAKKKAEEEAAKKKAEEEAAKKKAEAEAAKKKAEEEAAKKKAEEEAAKKKAEEEAAKKKAEAEAAKKKAEEEAAKQLAEAEATKKRAEAEAEKKKAEAEAAKKKAEAESAKKKEAEVAAKKKAEAESAKKKVEAEAAKKIAEAEAAKQKAEVEAGKKRDEEEASKKNVDSRPVMVDEKKMPNAKPKEDELKDANKKTSEEVNIKLEAQRRAQEKAVKEAEEARQKAMKADQKPKAGDSGHDSKDGPSSRSLSWISEQLESISQVPNDSADKESLLAQLSQDLELLEQSPLAMLHQAAILEQLASIRRSNPILEQAISILRDVLLMGREVPDEIFAGAGDKCVELMKFRGWHAKSIRIHQMLIQRFESNPIYRKNLGVAFLTMGNNNAAKQVFQELLSLFPSDYFSKAHLGFILKSEALERNDDKLLVEGVSLIEDGIKSQPVDSKEPLEGLFYFHLGDGFRRLNNPAKADEIFALGSQRGIFPSFWQRSLYNEPDLRAQPVWHVNETGIREDLLMLKDNWRAIRDEALSVLDSANGGFVVETENLKDTGYWAQFDLYVQGQRNAKNCAKVPLTCALIDSIPEIKGCRRGQVKFSVMKSGTHVHAHSGPTNCRLRAHLGLQIPISIQDTSSSMLRVADQYLSWQNGELFVFDDSFDHEVWYNNENNQSRLVLILDFWHPDLNPEKRATLPAI